ncbi:MAG: alpha/beta fold hydrolase [Dehalococcoidia bacterium]
MPPSIRYTSADDGTRLAYSTFGEGPPLLCLPPFPFSHLETGWRLEGQRAWLERLGRHAQLATYDARGTGLSDRETVSFDLETMTADLEAVRAPLGWEQCALWAAFNATPVAIAFAARHPERVSELVLWGPFARGIDVYPAALPADASSVVDALWPMLVDTAARTWTASAGDEAAEVASFFRECVEPATAVASIAAARAYDVTSMLASVEARTLVLQRAQSRVQRPELAQSLAASIRGAELVNLEGDAASPFAGDVDAGIEAIERFLGLERIEGGATSTDDGALEALTPREHEILVLLARGQANKEIANALDVSIHTVERHLTNLYAKLDCRSRTEAVAFALRHGLG